MRLKKNLVKEKDNQPVLRLRKKIASTVSSPSPKKTTTTEPAKVDTKKNKLNTKKEEAKKSGYLRTDIPGFDELFTHGIPLSKSILLEGSPGTGKTIFCLQTGYNQCLKGKRVLYMSFEESESSLLEHMNDFGWDPASMQKKGLFKVKRFSSIDVARSVEALLSEAKRELLIAAEPIIFPKDFDPEIVLIDSLTSIASAFSGELFRFRVFMEQLFRFMESKKISSILIKETPQPTHIGNTFVRDEHGAISFLSDGIICIYNVVYPKGRRGNALEVLKMRGEAFKKKLVKAEITSKGVVVNPEEELEGDYILS